MRDEQSTSANCETGTAQAADAPIAERKPSLDERCALHVWKVSIEGISRKLLFGWPKTFAFAAVVQRVTARQSISVGHAPIYGQQSN